MSKTNDRLWLALFIGVFLFSSAIAHVVDPVYLPTLENHPYIGVRTFSLEDKSRCDPFAPNHVPREVVVSLFYPAAKLSHKGRLHCDEDQEHRAPKTRYMPDVTAAFYDIQLSANGIPNGTFERLFTHSQENAPISARHPEKEFPLLVFSPGYGISRLLYTSVVQEVSRHGYIVASIDHPYDAGIVEFPNGKVVIGIDLFSPDGLVGAVATRAKDISFVINELSHPSPSVPFKINTDRVVVFGHSLGGASAANAILSDSRIAGGVNFDGNFFGEFNTTDEPISRPFLLFRAANRRKIGVGQDWDKAWKKLTGWKLDLELQNSTHLTFSDFPVLAETVGIRASLGQAGEELLGTLDGMKGLEIMSKYVSAFAKYVLTGKKDSILSGEPSRRFPEVNVIRK